MYVCVYANICGGKRVNFVELVLSFQIPWDPGQVLYMLLFLLGCLYSYLAYFRKLVYVGGVELVPLWFWETRDAVGCCSEHPLGTRTIPIALSVIDTPLQRITSSSSDTLAFLLYDEWNSHWSCCTVVLIMSWICVIQCCFPVIQCHEHLHGLKAILLGS